MSPLKYKCHRGTPRMSGWLDHPAWENAPWTPAFIHIDGNPELAPAKQTRAKMLWDDDYFYVGAWLEENEIWATLTEHDSVIFQDNDFEVFIDPDGDTLRYFEFEVNAFGTTWDLFLDKPYRFQGNADNGWESDALVAVAIDGQVNQPSATNRGWGVEIAFPWQCFQIGCSQLPPLPGDTWRVNFSRVEWAVDVIDGRYVKRPGLPEMNYTWSPQPEINMHIPEAWGFVEFAD